MGHHGTGNTKEILKASLCFSVVKNVIICDNIYNEPGGDWRLKIPSSFNID
jgi:hypothetical protein